MARLRYVKDLAATSSPATGTRHVVRSIRARYETDPAIARALLPRPLVASERPEMFVQFAHVSMHLASGAVQTVGAATVGVACSHEGRPGHYVLAMPMEGEFVVIAGREKFGEPKKLARTRFSDADGAVRGVVERHGVDFLELGGRLGPALPTPAPFTEHFYCFKAQPAIAPTGRPEDAFDGTVFLTRLIWERNYTSVRQVLDPEIVHRESPFDPLIDVPVRRILSMEFAEGGTRTSGELVCEVPGAYLAAHFGQRMDEVHGGIEVPTDAAAEVSGG